MSNTDQNTQVNETYKNKTKQDNNSKLLPLKRDPIGEGLVNSSVYSNHKISATQDESLIELKGKRYRKTQACDRCRLKKIKCDGAKPACGNCCKANFNCVTSDKLSRRGLPKGYTEALEQELIRLKNLLKQNGIQFVKAGSDINYTEDQPKDTTNQDYDSLTTTTSSVQQNSKQKSSQDPLQKDILRSKSISNHPSSSPTPKISHPNIYQHQLPFINDTFYKQKNIIYSQQNRLYMGNNFWNKLMSSNDKNFIKDLKSFNVTLEKEEKALYEQHISLMVNLLNLNPRFFYLPQFLVQKFKNDEKLLKKLLLNSLNQFFKIQNSLIPLLYPAKFWQQSLIDLIDKFENRNYSQKLNSDIKPHHLLCLLIIIQINWSCLDNLRLLQVIRAICLNSFFKDIERIQVLNLASFFFMGHGQKSPGENVWTSTLVNELLNLNFSLINDVGLYINLRNLKPLTIMETLDNNNSSDNNISMVTYWCFEFLNSWWGLIQGLPKTNFISSEFQPKKIFHTKQSGLIPFSILLEYITDKINGCDLLYCLKDDSKAQMILENESYRDKLKSKNLYFHSNEKKIPFENDQDMFLNPEEKKLVTNGINDEEDEESHLIILEKSEIIEIQLTLYYLVMTLLLNQKYKFTKDNLERVNQLNNSDSIAYEILCLYYLLMKQKGKEQTTEFEYEYQLHQPIQFHISHILPCSNEDIINMCLEVIIEWGLQQKKKINTKTPKKSIKREELWRFKKYKVMLQEWCGNWFDMNDMKDPLYVKIRNVYGFEITENGDNQNGGNDEGNRRVKKFHYLKALEEFNNLGYSNNILLKTDSKAIMDQFNIFESSINNISSLLPHSMSTFMVNSNFNNDQMSQSHDITSLHDSKVKDIDHNMLPYENHINHNYSTIIKDEDNSMNLVSSYMKNQDETDDGYAEDDDEEDEDDNKPLEIPFMNKRRSSLFHQKRIQPPAQRLPTTMEGNHISLKGNDLKRTAKELSLLSGSVTPKRPKIPSFSQTPTVGATTDSRNMSNITIPANSPGVTTENQPTLNNNPTMISNPNTGTASPTQQLLLPHMPMGADLLSKTLIKSPFASTLFLQEGSNGTAQIKSTALLDNFKSNDSLLNQFHQNQQQNNKSQLQLFSKEVTPRSFMNIMLTGKRNHTGKNTNRNSNNNSTRSTRNNSNSSSASSNKDTDLKTKST